MAKKNKSNQVPGAAPEPLKPGDKIVTMLNGERILAVVTETAEGSITASRIFGPDITVKEGEFEEYVE